jgi:pimeloyl-ACP methyl ester carboxylesterase
LIGRDAMSDSDGHYPYVGNDPDELESASGDLGHVGGTLGTLAGEVEHDTASIKQSWPQGHTGQVAAQDAARMGAALEECHQVFNRAERALIELHPVLVTGRRKVKDLNDAYRVLSAAQGHSLEDLLHVNNNDVGIMDQPRRQHDQDALRAAQARAGFATLAEIDRAYTQVVAQVAAESDVCNQILRRLTDGGRPLAGHAAGESKFDDSFGLLSACAGQQVADIVSGRTPFPTDPNAVHDVWLELSADQQAELLKGDPGRFGNLNGIPAKDRDTANRLTLQKQLDGLKKACEEAGVKPLISSEDVEQTDYHVLDWLATKAGLSIDEAKHAVLLDAQLKRGSEQLGEARLLAYEPVAYGDKGRAAIAYGDVDHADNVAFCVPGLNSSLGNLNQVSGDALHLLDAARHADPGRTTAVVAWQGYDAPGLTDVLFQDNAEAGAKLLAADVNAMRTTHDGPIGGKLTVVGHSYGSTTTGLALQREHLNVDQVALIGSPGVGGDARTSADLGLDKSRVFVGSASRDIVTTAADSLGADPSLDGFGESVTRFKAESVNRTVPLTFKDHSLYYDAGNQSESLYSLANIVTGHGDLLGQEGMLAQPRHTVYEPSMGDSGPVVVDPEASRTPTAGNDPGSINP